VDLRANEERGELPWVEVGAISQHEVTTLEADGLTCPTVLPHTELDGVEGVHVTVSGEGPRAAWMGTGVWRGGKALR